MAEAEPLPDGGPAVPPTAVHVVESDPPGQQPGELWPQRAPRVGGWAVLEGVMMRGVSTWAVAVRKPAEEIPGSDDPARGDSPLGEIAVSSSPIVPWSRRRRLF